MMERMSMTRRVSFSSGHRYWLQNLSQEENRSLFGKWASPYNHGHNYVLDVTVAGSVDAETGMIVNIKRIDDVLQDRIVAVFDQRSINDEVEGFLDMAPSLENILNDLSKRLENALPSEATLVGLKLEETPLIWADLNGTKMTLTRVYEFAASHRLNAPSLSLEENLRLFGKCNNPAGHGHNYVLEVTVEGEPDPLTGFICDLEALDREVTERVVDRYDHKNLNEDLPEFADRPTTSEIVTLEIFQRLKDRLPAKLHRVRLWETARNAFEVEA
jgi:6-pyruvoyltetrahydropterin/6-carboxytetrahydropterin synthase